MPPPTAFVVRWWGGEGELRWSPVVVVVVVYPSHPSFLTPGAPVGRRPAAAARWAGRDVTGRDGTGRDVTRPRRPLSVCRAHAASPFFVCVFLYFFFAWRWCVAPALRGGRWCGVGVAGSPLRARDRVGFCLFFGGWGVGSGGGGCVGESRGVKGRAGTSGRTDLVRRPAARAATRRHPPPRRHRPWHPRRHLSLPLHPPLPTPSPDPPPRALPSTYPPLTPTETPLSSSEGPSYCPLCAAAPPPPAPALILKRARFTVPAGGRVTY